MINVNRQNNSSFTRFVLSNFMSCVELHKYSKVINPLGGWNSIQNL
jgi:hypothetical protein